MAAAGARPPDKELPMTRPSPRRAAAALALACLALLPPAAGDSGSRLDPDRAESEDDAGPASIRTAGLDVAAFRAGVGMPRPEIFFRPGVTFRRAAETISCRDTLQERRKSMGWSAPLGAGSRRAPLPTGPRQ